MNVIRMENSKVRPARGRGRGKGRDSLYWKPGVDKMITNTFGQPKYQSSISDSRATPRGLFNTQQSPSLVITPSSARRISGIPTSSSKIRNSASTNAQPASTSSVTLDSTVIMAITTGRGDARCEVGMAAIDVKFPHLIISQISDTQTYTNTLTKIHFFNPVEILMPETICGEEDPRKTLYNAIKLRFKEIQITPVGRVHFNEENGLDRIKMHCSNKFSSIELFVKEKYYALATTAALLKYVEQIQRIIYEPQSMKIEFQASQGSTLIDVESAINLELVSSQGPQKNHNLFASLDRCMTPMGRRLLRSSLLQPLCNRDAILERQTCVSELVHNRNLHTILQPIVKQLFGADRLFGLSMRTTFIKDTIESAERNLNYVLILKTCLDVIPQLADALENVTSQKFVKIRENLKDPRFESMREQILQIVQSDAKSVNGYTSANMQRCFALKSGINDMLDVARQTYCELLEQTTILVESLAKEHRLPLIVACNASLGYHIQMQVPKDPSFKINDLPCIFIEVQKKRSTLFMTTYLLMSLSQQCKEARNDLHIMSSCILEALIANLRNQIGCLFKLSEDIAELDVIMSLARISGIPDFVKPTFAQNLQIIESKHPIVDLLANQLPRPNDIEASMAYNFCNITGPNMSGKTTYLKQIVLLQIMAQIGCYLPAKKATLRIADRIFCRLCPTYEDIESNASSFIQEIREVEYILQFITPSSLVVLDEICRSTNSEEGAPLAFAICESLLQSTAYIFNCTHYLYLTKLTELYHNAVNYYFVCEPNELDKWGLKYTYKLRKGITNVENYGISAASVSRLPKSIVENAKRIVTVIAPHFKPAPLVKAPKLSWEKDCYDCISKFMELIISNEFTLKNVQEVIEPLRDNRNLKISKENALLCNVLQKNFQKQVPDYENINAKLQTASSVPQIDTGKSKIVQYNPEYFNNIVISDREIFNFHKVHTQVANVVQNNSAINATKSSDQMKPLVKFSNTDQSKSQIDRELSTIDQINFIDSNLIQQHSLDNNFSFKIPTSPKIRHKISVKIDQRNSIQNSDVNDFGILEKFQYVDKSLADKRNRTLYEFGFSNERVDNGTTNFQNSPNKYIQSTNNNFESKFSDTSNFVTEKSSSNLSSYSMRSKMSKDFNHEETSENSRMINISSSNTPKNWYQEEIVSESNSLKRISQCDEDENYGSPARKNGNYFNKSRNYQEKIETENENFSTSPFQTQKIRRTSSSNVSSDQQEIVSPNINFEYNCQSDNDNVIVRTNSPVPSLSIFSPKNLLPHSSICEKNYRPGNDDISHGSQSQKISFSTFTPSHSLLEQHSENKNISNFSSFESNSYGTFYEKKRQFNESSVSNVTPSKMSLQNENVNEKFGKYSQSNQDNISRRSNSQTPSRVSHDSQESKNIHIMGSFNSEHSDSRSYLSPNYSPLIPHRREMDTFSKTHEIDISKSSLKLNCNLGELKNDQSTISRNSPQDEMKSRSSPIESKLRQSFQEERESLNKLSSQKCQFENPILSMIKNSLTQEIKSTKSPCKSDMHSQRDNYDQVAQPSVGLNLFKFSTSQSRITKPPIFKSNSDAWKAHDVEYFIRSLSQSHSVTFSEKSSISGEIESEGLLPKRPKYDIHPENLEINSTDESMDNDSLSSFHTENCSLASICTPAKSQVFSLTTKNSSTKQTSQNQVSSFAAKNSSQFIMPIQSQNNFSHLAHNENEHNLLKKNEDVDKVSLSDNDEDNKISQFESILDGNTIKYDEIFDSPPPPKQENNKSEVYVISSEEDSIEASANARRKENAIFEEIEENANDGEMFLRRLFQSPLSMPYSEELCSCGYSSN